MPAPDLLARELQERELAEDPQARAARLANQRWVTMARLWSAMERARITDPGDQARFICERLWPELRPDVVTAFVGAVERNTRHAAPLLRPLRARDVVGERLEQLMIEHGYHGMAHA
ncbi:MAG: hypothetical protein ABIR11_01465 [Candidatus Limnocylindrales bacterium]